MDIAMFMIFILMDLIVVLVCRAAYGKKHEYREGMLFGVHIPRDALETEEISELTDKYRRRWILFQTLNLLAGAGVCFICFLSFALFMTIWLIWLIQYVAGMMYLVFLPFLHRNRGSNPWGSTRVAALLHNGNLMCAIHWVSPGIGCVALTDELTAFQNHTASIPAKQRAMIFAASSYEEILGELDTGQEIHNTRLQTYREVYDCLKLPLFLLPCNGTGCLQLRILGVPNYRELLARIILKSHYVPPPADRTMYDAMYQGAPFVMAADMNLRRIDAAVETACSDGLSQIVLAALPEQAETVLNRRYRETGKARVFTITESALRELLGSTAPYAPPRIRINLAFCRTLSLRPENRFTRGQRSR